MIKITETTEADDTLLFATDGAQFKMAITISAGLIKDMKKINLDLVKEARTFLEEVIKEQK
tara:strand:- start:546 stop:728 length:183 start_codon:yes stop_codon:yes gene_type:complete